jgi:hypothetical protein
MTVEDQLRDAFLAETAAMPTLPDRWDEIEARAADARRGNARRRSRRTAGGLTVIGLAAATAAALVVVPALTRDQPRRVVVNPAGHSTTVVAPTTVPGPASPTTRSTAVAAPPRATTVPATGFGYTPLYPFASVDEANAWKASYQATGAQPWHLDPGQTALSFTGFLGYTDITTVVGARTDSTGAHVTVGLLDPNGRPTHAAVLHLRRFGTGADAPWEVVGTDDTTDFSLTTPLYGTTVTSPLKVGGAINGVDESIRVQVLQLSSSTPLGVSCCTPAGNSGKPWSATVTFKGATSKVIIVAASTGGHVASVERFTITGVRTSPGGTPGL